MSEGKDACKFATVGAGTEALTSMQVTLPASVSLHAQGPLVHLENSSKWAMEAVRVPRLVATQHAKMEKFAAGDNSCVGEKACWQAAHEHSTMVIGNARCARSHTCMPNLMSTSFTMGDNSCQCDGCCENLKDGSIIGDCWCNMLEDSCFNQAGPVVKESNLCPQDLALAKSANVLGLANSNMTIDLSPWRITVLPASVSDIDGDETFAGMGRRRMKGGKDRIPQLKHGGQDMDGWTLLLAGRLVSMTIAAKHRLTEGTSKVVIVNCMDVDSVISLISLDDALTLSPGQKRSHVANFGSPINVDGGVTLCFKAIRVGDV